VWALREAGHQIGGLNLVVDSTVPAGSGLSSSAALECAVATAATDLYEVDVSPTALARLAQQAENDFVGVPCGLMDQMVAMTATAGHALFFDTRTAATEQIPFDPAAADLAVMVIDTRFHHSLADGQYAARRGECERAATELGVAYLCDLSADDLEAATAGLADASIARRVRHVVTENERVRRSAAYLRDGKPADVGQLLTDSHRSLRDDFEVSCAQLDLAVDVALEGGALGARMTGGGFGGSAVALLAESAVEPAREAILTAFRRHAFTEPEMWVANPSRGAGREPD
jgi:galactokinase